MQIVPQGYVLHVCSHGNVVTTCLLCVSISRHLSILPPSWQKPKCNQFCVSPQHESCLHCLGVTSKQAGLSPSFFLATESSRFSSRTPTLVHISSTLARYVQGDYNTSPDKKILAQVFRKVSHAHTHTPLHLEGGLA